MFWMSFEDVVELYYSLRTILSTTGSLTKEQSALFKRTKAHLNDIDDCYVRERITENRERVSRKSAYSE